MGGVSWSVHNKLQEESKHQKNKITDLTKENEELKRRYEERQKEIRYQQELKEKEEKEFQNKRILAIEDMNNSLQKKQDEELLTIEKELENLSQSWCFDEIKEIDIEKILKDCFKQLIIGEQLEEHIKENVKQLIKNLIKKMK